MTEKELKQIQEMPKAILHLHLDGSLRPETVYKWLKEQRKDVTLEQVQKDLMVDKDCRDLNEYLQKFDLPSDVLQTEEHIEQATYEIFEDLAKQNVIYAEVRFAPTKHTEKGLSYNQVAEAAIRGMEKAKQQFEIDGNLILCCMRGEESIIRSLQTVATAKKYLGKGVCALDLAGAEALYPTKDYIEIFELARKYGIPLTIHAGEAEGPKSIRTAVEYADRIGNGVRCFEDLALVAELIQREIVLEVCPTSNLQTNAIQNVYEVIEELYKRGVKITINTDNNSVSNINVIEEDENLLKNTKLTIKDLIQMNINAIDGAFIPPQKKAELKAIIKECRASEDKQK